MTPAEAHALETLFDHQMWAFGRDVTRPAGNLFALKGLVRSPAPAGVAHSSTWTDAGGDFRVHLSSLGVSYERGEHVFRLERGPLLPQLRSAPIGLLPALAAWMAAYERWVHEIAPGWRAEALAARRRPSRFEARALEQAWTRWSGIERLDVTAASTC